MLGKRPPRQSSARHSSSRTRACPARVDNFRDLGTTVAQHLDRDQRQDHTKGSAEHALVDDDYKDVAAIPPAAVAVSSRSASRRSAKLTRQVTGRGGGRDRDHAEQ